MLDNITQSALSLLSCQLAWLLIHDDEILVTAALAASAADTEEAFLGLFSRHYPDGIIPAKLGSNPLGDILLRNTPLVGLSVEKLDPIAGSEPFILTLSSFGLRFVSIVPLRRGEHLMGVLLLAASSNEHFSSAQGQLIIRLLRRQAVLELENLDLSEQLAGLETQRQAEQNFYQVVLDTIGDGVVMTDKQGLIQYVSQRLLLMTDYTSGELLGQPLKILFNEESWAALDEIAREPRSSLAQKLKTRSGESVPILMSQVMAQSSFTEEDHETIAVVSLTDLSDLRSREQSLEKQTRRLQALNNAFQAIGSPLALQDVIQVILGSAREVVKAQAVALLLEDTEKDLVVVATLGGGDLSSQGRRVAIGSGVAGWVAQEAESLLLTDVAHDARFDARLDGIAGLDTQSIAAVPLIAYNKVIGVLAVINRVKGTFDADDLEVLENLSTSAAIAIENATLFDQTHRRLTELSTLLDSSAIVAASVDLNATLEHISRRLREALAVQRVVISTVDRRSAHVIKLAEVVDAQWTFENAPTTALVEYYSKRTALMKNQPTTAGMTDLPTADHSELEVRGMKSALNVPLRFKGDVIGLVTLYGEDALTVGQAAAIEKAILQWQAEVQNPWNDLTVLCHRVLQATELRWCAVYRWDQQAETLQLIRELGLAAWQSSDGPLSNLDDFGSVRHVIEHAGIQSVVTSQMSDFNERNYYRQLGVVSAMIAPVRIQSQVVGVVRIMAVDEHDFDDSMYSLSQGVANIIGNALENSALYSSLEKRAQALEAAYREIEQADRLKDELLQNLSHELGTPLTHILGYLSLLEDGAFGEVSEDQKSTLQMSIRKTQQVAELVKHMVTVHASNAYKLNLKETQLEQLAALAIRTMTPKAKTANIRIVTRIPPQLPLVQVDQVTMSEVFEALLDNAIKFSQGGKLIEVSIVDTKGPMLQVSVRDEGIGISKDEHDKVFREFYQVDGSMTRKYSGMGLGLSIVQKIVMAHGGRVWLESEAGQGTCIYFTVPKNKFEDNPANHNKGAFAIS